MELKQQMIHTVSPILLQVFVKTTSLQDGHWVTAGVWPRLSTSTWERDGEHRYWPHRHSDVNRRVAEAEACAREAVWLTCNDWAGWSFWLLTPSFDCLLRWNVLLCQLGRRQHVDPPAGCLSFIKSGTQGQLTWFKNMSSSNMFFQGDMVDALSRIFTFKRLF